jgi:hypothetical protein
MLCRRIRCQRETCSLRAAGLVCVPTLSRLSIPSFGVLRLGFRLCAENVPLPFGPRRHDGTGSLQVPRKRIAARIALPIARNEHAHRACPQVGFAGVIHGFTANSRPQKNTPLVVMRDSGPSSVS